VTFLGGGSLALFGEQPVKTAEDKNKKGIIIKKVLNKFLFIFMPFVMILIFKKIPSLTIKILKRGKRVKNTAYSIYLPSP
jgi:hypothetical protein